MSNKVVHEVQGFGTWRLRADGTWIASTDRGVFEAKPGRAPGSFVLWWSTATYTQSKVISTRPLNIEQAFEYASEYRPDSEGVREGVKECGCAHESPCAHTHPPSVPTDPCPAPSKASRRGGYKHELSFGSNKEAAKFGRSLKARGAKKTHVFDGVVYTNAPQTVIGKSEKSTRLKPAVAGVREASGREALVIHERKVASELPVIARDPVSFGACMDRARKLGTIRTARDVNAILGAEMSAMEQEAIVVVPIDVHDHLRGCGPVMVAYGQRSASTVDPADVTRAAITAGGEKLFLVHNHPTGDAVASKDDFSLTESIRQACKATNLKLVDHVVIGIRQFYSIREKKLHRV